MNHPKVKITFVLPSTLQQDLKKQINRDGYDAKEKSRWVSEAIESLLMMQSFPELVKISDEMKGFQKLESVLVSRELKRVLNEAIIAVRKAYPLIEGVQSRILRTAILQRLLR